MQKWNLHINNCPIEILSEIFKLAAHLPDSGNNNKEGFIINKQLATQFKILGVCRLWRAIALSLQVLWVSFYCFNDTFTRRALSYWLSLSGASALYLGLTTDPLLRSTERDGVASIQASKEMVRFFGEYSDRWDTLIFDSQYAEVTGEFTEMLHDAASRVPVSPLRSIQINLWWHQDDKQALQTIARLLAVITLLRNVRDVSWKIDVVQEVDRPLDLVPMSTTPWNALDRLYLKAYLKAEDIFRWMRHCTSARTITLLSTRGQSTAAHIQHLDCNYGEPFILRNLETLTVNENCNPSALFRLFTMPSLVTLSIPIVGPAQGSSPFDAFGLQHFFARSQCPLERFLVEAPLLSQSDIMSLVTIPYLRDVKDVVVTVWSDPEQFIVEQVNKHPHLLQDMPKLTTWESWPGSWEYNIGWSN